MSSGKKGSGFTPPNYTQTPNQLFDLLDVISNAELRITLALVRETFGWHRQRTEIMSTSELAQKAGVSESSAKTGIKEGVQRGTIKRFRARDERNRPTYKYGLVITDRVSFEAFERRRKEDSQDDQDGTQGSLTGQILTGSEFDRSGDLTGQNLTPSPEDLTGQNLTPSYIEERKILIGKKVVGNIDSETPSVPQSEHDDETGEDEPDQQRAHTPPPLTQDDQPGRNRASTAQGIENVPPPGPHWNPADVTARLNQLTNRRWTNHWRKRGEAELQKPMVDETDGSGVNRWRIATLISLEQLEQIETEVRRERTRMIGAGEPTYTFLHMLIQALQAAVLRIDQLRLQVEDFQGQDQPPPSLSLPQAREWAVGDLVSYRREQYRIEQVTARKIVLESPTAGGVDIIRGTQEIEYLKLVHAAEAPREASA